MRISSAVSFTNAYVVTASGWGTFNTGAQWTNPANAISTNPLVRATCTFATQTTQNTSFGLFLEGFGNLVSAIGKSSRIFGIEVSFTANKASSSPAMNFSKYVIAQKGASLAVPAAYLGPTFSKSPIALATTDASYSTGAVTAGALLGFDLAPIRRGTVDKPYITGDMLTNYAIGLVFTAATTPGVNVGFYNAKIRAIYDTNPRGLIASF